MRIQDNILAGPERRLLGALCRVMPRWVTPDGLTAAGLAGGAVVMAGDALGRGRPALLWIAVLGYLMHWFGDSMDGSLARFRGIERPRYGRYVDHATDALSNFLIMAGLGLTGHVSMALALFTIAAYLMLTLHVVLRAEALGDFRISFLLLGPTELRVVLVAITLSIMAFGDVRVRVAGVPVSAYDLPIGFAGAMFVLLFCANLAGTARTLRRIGG